MSSELICTECNQSYTAHRTEWQLLGRLSPTFNNEKIELPHSKLCPGCRELYRLAYRNEWNLYRRTCNHSGQDLIAIYSKNSQYLVFDLSIWWSDEYDPLEYGRDFDFSKPFFEQFHELNLAVPKLAIQNAKSHNSAYTNYSLENKNCYMVVGTGHSEDCYYCYRVWSSKNVLDCYDLQECELCYECSQSSKLYECIYSKNCHNSSRLSHCENCRSCSDCLGCSNLRNKQFCIFDEQLSESEYQKQRNRYLQDRDSLQTQYHEARTLAPTPNQYQINCEDCSGNQLLNCSRCIDCFTLKDSQDCIYFGTGESGQDCLDSNFCDSSELQYFSTNLQSNYRIMFSALVWYTNHGSYLTNCFNSSHLFGCTGMKKNSFCILNKQYSEKEYQRLTSKIVHHMQETKEWGKFFPIEFSPFPINKSVGHEYYPVSHEKALSRGWRWEEKEESTSSSSADLNLLQCDFSGQLFRIIPQERSLLNRLRVELPAKSPQVRHSERMAGIKRAIENYC